MGLPRDIGSRRDGSAQGYEVVKDEWTIMEVVGGRGFLSSSRMEAEGMRVDDAVGKTLVEAEGMRTVGKTLVEAEGMRGL